MAKVDHLLVLSAGFASSQVAATISYFLVAPGLGIET
jgi:hypothetical protein